MKLYLVKNTFGALKAADEASEENLKSIPIGEMIEVKLKSLINPHQFGLFFAMRDLVFDNLPEKYHKFIHDRRALLDNIKYAIKWYDIRYDISGKPFVSLRTISPAATTKADFASIFSAAKFYIITELLEGITEDQLMDAVIDRMSERSA